ncbi:transporter substrate-binding domain-containing protein [Cupriavidus necator]|uniref:transporter substrate-binding domain-containing protein n=1 Tax=Cupriavidus necator TaxID=106590 RepID=UPI0027819075|nr:transporter substrate-binding domain-containing protein [Cupriavidus necator]MDQ0141194.1 glutamate/aspartate transport system substrate-binding protein [Cupriavidus necator]
MMIKSRLLAVGVSLSMAAVVGSVRAAEPMPGFTLAKIKTANSIALGHRTTSIPFSYYDSSQNVVGFSHDVCMEVVEQVKKRLALPALQVRMIPVTSQNRISLVQNGIVDLECGITSNIKVRQQQVAFSNTIFVAGPRLLVKKGSGINDFGDLGGKTVVTNAGTTSERILRKMNDERGTNIRIYSSKDYGESFLILQSGRAAAFMLDDVVLYGTRSSATNPEEWTVVGTPQSVEPYALMMRKDDPEFKALVDGTLAAMMRSGRMAAIYEKWFQKPVPPKGTNFNLPMSDAVKKAFASPNDLAFD